MVRAVGFPDRHALLFWWGVWFRAHGWRAMPGVSWRACGVVVV